MFEKQTFNTIMNRCLDRVSGSIDKREGSIIYDALAPAVVELTELYIVADTILREVFATTASRPSLIKIASEFNIKPYEATKATVKGVFNKEIPIGSKFNYQGKFTFTVIKQIDGDYTYELQCNEPGVEGNDCIGNITPVGNIEGLTSAKIVSLISPASNEEDTEIFRKRFFNTIKSKAYGGNGADYQQKVNAIVGVGGCKVYRTPNGGGTVGITIINNQYNKPDAQMIKDVQEIIYPQLQAPGGGYGVAPIGHVVTVKGVDEKKINITMRLSTKSDTSFNSLKSAITSAIDEYFKTLRVSWADTTEKGHLTVRTAHIISKILTINGVIDVTNVAVNGNTDKIELASDEIPIVGEVSNS